MCNKIIFIGGVHGVGKGTLCEELVQRCPVVHLSSSELINWSEMNDDPCNKLVGNVSKTQDRLVEGLHNALHPNCNYLLDGHFCLLTDEQDFSDVPFETFEAISPCAIILVTCNPQIICERLNSRDKKFYSTELIDKMQNAEIERCMDISRRLNVECIIITSEQIEEAQKFVMSNL